MPGPLLVLWDVDYTLIETGGVGTEVYAAAFEEVTGRPLAQMPDVWGRTEPAIFRDALALHGIEDPGDLFARFAEAQARGYAGRLAELRERGRALPGADEALRALADRADVIQTVLTGNTRLSAQIKLAAFGLDDHLDLEVGAYGTDAPTRAELVAVARRRVSERTGRQLALDAIVVIGDTPADVAAAHGAGVRIIAVATGRHTIADLTEAGADTVLPGLAETSAVIAAVRLG